MDCSSQINRAYSRRRSRMSFQWTPIHLTTLANDFKTKYNTASRHTIIIQLLDKFNRLSLRVPSYNAVAKKMDACVYLLTGIGSKYSVSSAHAATWLSSCLGCCRIQHPPLDDTCTKYGDCFDCGAPLDDKIHFNLVPKCDCCANVEEIVVCCDCADHYFV